MYDTLMYVKKLEAVGLSREQAEVQVQIMAEIIDTNLATKQDLKDQSAELRGEMAHLRIDLETQMKDIRHEMINMENRLTIKLGSMMVIGFGALATMMKLL